ncbi:neuritin-like protein isoform X2 [Canis lupus baileyi]|nr:neuritin-like protein isoform X2 [Canis lupus familiaris]XP_025282364.1 neuritin-like protein isoform X2 [Canis lupus dingo]XP_038394500.1 neuritin-like protein isoform X2 [Canis lupus familiaris]XP_038523227.1 neuritin-like protein isoform X2 [Canis lupus familiaris]|eukprot:XP_013969549.1 neuritin-like protein isoform X2 [Canis lupus familiaris]
MPSSSLWGPSPPPLWVLGRGHQLALGPAPGSHPITILSYGGWAEGLRFQAASSSTRLPAGDDAGMMRRYCSCHHRQPLPRPSAVLGLLLLLLPLAAPGTGGCDTIYQGFAECLIRLGDSMGLGGELETVCRSWNDFHICASRVLLRCPEEAAAVWESLQQEARRAPHPDNLHALCSTPVSVREHGTGPETNQETLQARAAAPTPAPTPPLLAAALAFACLLGPLA